MFFTPTSCFKFNCPVKSPSSERWVKLTMMMTNNSNKKIKKEKARRFVDMFTVYLLAQHV